MEDKKRKGRGITHKQRKLLRYAIKILGLEDHYRDILSRCAGVTSSSALDLAGFRAVMNYLDEQGFKYRQAEMASRRPDYASYLEKWKHQVGNRPGMATPEQLALLDALWDELEWWWNKNGKGDREAALRGFLQRQCGVSFLEFLKFRKEEDGRSGAHELIESLKAIRARRKARGKAPKKA